ncbi:MAG: hypothetical protein AAGI53_02585 [Planctomycetota bacterium]
MAKRSAKKRGRKSAGPAASGPGLGLVSTAELAREIKRRERQLEKLETKREALMTQVADLDHEISSLGALLGTAPRASGVGGGPRRRPRNDMNLADALQKTLGGVTLSVTEAAEAVQRDGYKTSAANFRTIVNQTLLRETDRFKKVARGQYTAK